MREHPEGQCVYCDAVEAFEAWVSEHDPNSELTLLDQVETYAKHTANQRGEEP